jgi:hypothetical protein
MLMIRNETHTAPQGARNALSEMRSALRAFAPLYQSDEEIARLILGSQAGLWPRIVRQLEREGLPAPRELLGRLRYVPAVLHFFDRREGLLGERPATFAEDGPERFTP